MRLFKEKSKMNFRKIAMNIAMKAHVGQTDKAGKPYIEHPVNVASAFEDDQRYITALLHDVVEDSDITFDDLRNEGFDENILEAIIALTRTNIGYQEYIERIKKNPIARDVKIQDLKHNMDLNRLDNVNVKDIKRLEKYKKALKYLDY
ncbi:MAG: GTP pyrophosphokinase [Fusobacteria bacterium]|nr:MAG: GTP pyrophosphokinase [Fusobacteriota bacterium]KAF0228592.1 MAG: hypothetical protein FD182_848 [Fusobacteriota bacterium]